MSYQLSKIKVLVVEDNKPMLELTKSILKSFGIGNVITALNGEDGFREFCATNPDLVIVDWMMEPMDGISMCRHIRNSDRSPNQYVPVILMTGFSEKKRVLLARDAGITEFLVKPFNVRGLYKRIFQIIEKPRQFVRCENFFGPDRRRRKKEDDYQGPFRRKTDVKKYKASSKAKTPIDEIDFR